MSILPDYIKYNILNDKDYYSLYKMENLTKCKKDADYLGDVLVVNQNLIWHSIHKYVGKPESIARNNGINKDDIYQLGVMGFIKAIKAFDVNRGIKFSSFAVTAIVREVRCYIRDSSNIIRLSRTASSLLHQTRKVEDEFGYLPNTVDLAILLDTTEDKITKALQIGKSVKHLDESISTPCGLDEYLTLYDKLEDLTTDIEAEVVDKIYIKGVLTALKPQLTTVEFNVLLGQLNGLTQTQISKEYGLSSMKVSRSMKKIVTLLRNYLSIQSS